MQEGTVAVLGVVIAGVIASILEPDIYTLGSAVVGAALVLILKAYDTPLMRKPSCRARAALRRCDGAMRSVAMLRMTHPLWIQ